jgi:hypothetical protein
VRSRPAAQGLLGLAVGEHAAAAAAEREGRATAWHTFADGEFRRGGRRVYRWIREPASAARPPWFLWGVG